MEKEQLAHMIARKYFKMVGINGYPSKDIYKGAVKEYMRAQKIRATAKNADVIYNEVYNELQRLLNKQTIHAYSVEDQTDKITIEYKGLIGIV